MRYSRNKGSQPENRLESCLDSRQWNPCSTLRRYIERDPAEPRRLGNSIRQRGTDVTSEGRAQAHRWVSKAELTRGIQIEPHWRTTATAPSKDSRCAWLIGPFAGRIPTNSRPAGGGSCSIVDSWGVHVSCAARSSPELEGTQYRCLIRRTRIWRGDDVWKLCLQLRSLREEGSPESFTIGSSRHSEGRR